MRRRTFIGTVGMVLLAGCGEQDYEPEITDQGLAIEDGYYAAYAVVKYDGSFYKDIEITFNLFDTDDIRIGQQTETKEVKAEPVTYEVAFDVPDGKEISRLGTTVTGVE